MGNPILPFIYIDGDRELPKPSESAAQWSKDN